MQIETPRLLLREMTEADRDALAAILTDAETMKYYPKPYDDAGVRRWLDWTFDNYRKHGFGFPAVYSYMNAENEPSWRTAMKNGMAFVEEYDAPDGERLRVYRLDRADWERRCKQPE